MSGFCGIVSRGGKIEFPDRVADEETGRTARRGDLRVAEKFLDKFADDKCFGDRGNYFVCLDGVTLNSRELVRSFAATDIGSAVAGMAAKDPSGFPASLRGGFGGFVWDVAGSKGVLFTNHFGSRYLYYSYDASTGATFFFLIARGHGGNDAFDRESDASGRNSRLLYAQLRLYGRRPDSCGRGAQA